MGGQFAHRPAYGPCLHVPTIPRTYVEYRLFDSHAGDCVARPELSVARRLGTYGIKAYLGEVSNSLNVRLDQVLIAAFLPAQELGLYVVAVSASQLAIMVSFSIRTVLQPRLINQSDHLARQALIRSGLLQYSIAGGLISLLLAAAVPFAIPLLFGDDFQGAIAPTEILIWAVYSLGFKTILAGVAQAYGDPWLASHAELIGAGVTIATLAILVPTIGIVGRRLAP